jgi:PKD repeat protein
MKKVFLILFVLSGLVTPLFAAHIRGGELYYKYEGVGASPNTSRYTITLKLYIDCNSQVAQDDATSPITIFAKTAPGVYGQIKNISVAVNSTRNARISYDPASNPCISNPPLDVCYLVRYYETVVELDDSQYGYTIAYQRCCRIVGIQNMAAPSNDFGATYTCEIPGSVAGVTDAFKNSSPVFNPNDAVAICFGSPFTFDFSARDPEKDSIVYQLCNAYNGGGPGTNGNNCATCAQPDPAAPPPYSSIPYSANYSGSSPLGLKASINPATGIISGTAPTVEGQYVVTVCAYEYRDKKLFNIHRKDIHIRVSDCIPLKALLDPDLAFCDDFLVTFKNKQANPAGSVYIWQYGDNTKPDTVTTLEGSVQHQYTAPGTYNIKLKVILAGQCVDSTTAKANVYPGFFPKFRVDGTCVLLPLQFIDESTTNYGVVDKWTWNFGDETTNADTSHLKNPFWKYASTGSKPVTLTVGSSNGCSKTINLPKAEVLDKPKITLDFKDALICSNAVVQDTITLKASGNGIFTWTPLTRILSENTANPKVYPTTTTMYKVFLNENGCVNTDSVKVRVVDRVTLEAGGPMTICLTDTVQLKPATDGLKFTWTTNPSPSPMSDNKAKEPFVSPTSVNTQYTVLAEIGKCSISDALSIRTVPYPTARAGKDTTICYDDTASLNASMVAAYFSWTPTSTLSNTRILNPLAWPLKTTIYTLRVTDTLGCPKPSFDYVEITVLDQIFANAGNDTSVVIGQPLQMRGRGSQLYEWTPATYLNRNNIPNPVANLSTAFTYQLKAYTPEGCFDLDTINIKVFRTSPEIFVPNAFKPDGFQNNVLRPIPVGISQLDYFRVFNRWGQMVFQTNQHGFGWDGKLSGKPQDPGVYVWVVSGKDYTGKQVIKKGTAMLIR